MDGCTESLHFYLYPNGYNISIELHGVSEQRVADFAELLRGWEIHEQALSQEQKLSIDSQAMQGMRGGWLLFNSIWQALMDYLFGEVVKGLNDFLDMMNNMGAETLDLPWVQALLQFFNYLGWTLFLAGLAVAIFDTTIEAQNSNYRSRVHWAEMHVLS